MYWNFFSKRIGFQQIEKTIQKCLENLLTCLFISTGGFVQAFICQPPLGDLDAPCLVHNWTHVFEFFFNLIVVQVFLVFHVIYP